MSDTNPRHDGEEPPAPLKLAAALKELPARRVFVPPTVDEAVLSAARRHLARPRRTGFNLFRSRLAGPAFAAACFCLVGLMWLGLIYHRARSVATEQRVAGTDIIRDRPVDILDAFQLARELQSGQKPPTRLDLNGDGAVDWRDVEILAARAVQLEKGGRS